MPIPAPSHIALDVMRPTALPDLAPSRAGLARPPEVAQAAFSIGGEGTGAPAEPGKAAAPEAFRKFEAMVLQTFIQNMLPKDGAAVYGKGMAGDMWKSLLAEKVAGVVAERGGIGIADRMLGARYAGEAKTTAEAGQVAAPQPVPAAPETGDRFPVAPAVLDGMARSLSELLAEAAATEDEVPSING